MLIKIGVTGQNGFIGSHLYQYFKNKNKRFRLIPFEDVIFNNESKLREWVTECDVIIHMAAISRHKEPNVVYETNISLVNKLVIALKGSRSKPHIIFASSVQEDNDSEYGKSKKEGRQLLAEWSKENNTIFTGLILPNIFGPLAKPYYASVIATFSYQLTHNIQPKIIVDSTLNLLYIDDLIDIIVECILKNNNNAKFIIHATDRKKVSDILLILKKFKDCYILNCTKPKLYNSFEINLFNTFISYITTKQK